MLKIRFIDNRTNELLTLSNVSDVINMQNDYHVFMTVWKDISGTKFPFSTRIKLNREYYDLVEVNLQEEVK